MAEDDIILCKYLYYKTGILKRPHWVSNLEKG